MRRGVAVLFLLVAFGTFLGPFTWMLLTIGVATGMGDGVHVEGGPARLASQLFFAGVSFLLYRYFDRPGDELPHAPDRTAS